MSTDIFHSDVCTSSSGWRSSWSPWMRAWNLRNIGQECQESNDRLYNTGSAEMSWKVFKGISATHWKSVASIFVCVCSCVIFICLPAYLIVHLSLHVYLSVYLYLFVYVCQSKQQLCEWVSKWVSGWVSEWVSELFICNTNAKIISHIQIIEVYILHLEYHWVIFVYAVWVEETNLILLNNTWSWWPFAYLTVTVIFVFPVEASLLSFVKRLSIIQYMKST